MSLTIQHIILDAKRLATRLKTREASGDSLIKLAQAVNKQIDVMKQYPDELDMLNEEAPQRPHAALIAGIQQENRHIREIQQENRELRSALEDHQHALEHIMSKYRQHTSQNVLNTRMDFTLIQNSSHEKTIKEQADKIQEMAAVMLKAASADDEEINCEEELMTRLTIENKGLREMLQISKKYGSNIKVTDAVPTDDKDVQTEVDNPNANT